MHFSKKASRLWTMFMAVAMCLSLSVPAFAAESPSTEEVSVISSDAQVYSAGNVPVNHRDNPVRGSAVYRITPSKGQVLKLQINNSINPDFGDYCQSYQKWWMVAERDYYSSQRARYYGVYLD